MLTFNFEDRFECIDGPLQEIKSTIFRTLTKPITQMYPDQSVQLQYALECYKVTTEEGDEDLRNINISEFEGLREVVGCDVKIPDMSQSVKIKQLNIGSE